MTTIQEIYQEGDKFAYEPHRSIALFSLILKHLEVAERQLKLRRFRECFRYTFGLTMSMIEQPMWWWRTEVETKELNNVLRRLAEHWTLILKNPKLKIGIGRTTRIALMSKLKQIGEFFDWVTKESTPALCFPIEIKEIDGTLVFTASNRSNSSTSCSEYDGEEASRVMPMNVDAQIDVDEPKKLSRRVNASPTGTQNLVKWCNDFEPKAVQRGAWQLRCQLIPGTCIRECEGRMMYHFEDYDVKSIQQINRTQSSSPCETRIIIVSGSYTMFALNKAIAHAFEWGVAVFEHHVNKGRCPGDSRFIVTRDLEDGEKCEHVIISSRKNIGKDGRPLPFINDRKIKVCHMFRDRGDHCGYLCEGNHVVVTCDGILSDKAKRRNRQPLPRCVGYSGKDGQSSAGLLNDEYCGERSGVVVMMNETDEDKLIEMTRDGMKRPLFSCTGLNLRASDYDKTGIQELWKLSLGAFTSANDKEEEEEEEKMDVEEEEKMDVDEEDVTVSSSNQEAHKPRINLNFIGESN